MNDSSLTLLEMGEYDDYFRIDLYEDGRVIRQQGSYKTLAPLKFSINESKAYEILEKISTLKDFNVAHSEDENFIAQPRVLTYNHRGMSGKFKWYGHAPESIAPLILTIHTLDRSFARS